MLIIGGGFVGTEVASACVEAGLRTEVLTLESRLVPQLGDDLAELVTRRALAAGLRLTRVDGPRTAPPGQQELRVVRSSAGRREADIVLTAVGDDPNLEWLADTAIERDRGIVVDQHCAAAPHIFAVGDVARVRTGHGVAARTPFWNAAIDQAPGGRGSRGAGTRGDAVPASAVLLDRGVRARDHHRRPDSGRRPVETLAGDLAAGAGLFRWEGGRGATVAAVNHRLPIRKLRALTSSLA